MDVDDKHRIAFLFCHVGNYVYYCNLVLVLCGGGNGLGTNVFVWIWTELIAYRLHLRVLSKCFFYHRLGGLRR